MTHREEIIRWANSPDDTKVWVKDISGWKIIDSPNWYASRAYVVDDKWAELAKQFIDDPTKVEFHRGTLGWEKTKCASAELLRSGSFSQYRLTPVYEWQWLYQVNGQYYLTQYWYKDKKEVMNQIMDAIDSLELFEPSKRLMR